MSVYLGIEGGATKTTAILVDKCGKLLKEIAAGPGNSRLMSNEKLTNHLKVLLDQFPKPSAIGIGLAGVREDQDRLRIVQIISEIHPDVPMWVGNDSETALAATAKGSSNVEANIIVICGTGSCIMGCRNDGVIVRVGGWGHILGDHGSGYDIARTALKAVLREYDYYGVWPNLGSNILRVLQLNEPNQLIEWSLQAQKDEIASLATEVFRVWDKGDVLADSVVRSAADVLIQQTNACVQRLVESDKAISVSFFGSILQKQSAFASLVETGIRKLNPNVTIQSSTLEGHWGAVEMARKHTSHLTIPGNKLTEYENVIPKVIKTSPTEERHPLSMDLDQQSLVALVDLMLREEAKVPKILLQVKLTIVRAVEVISQTFQSNGRLFYVGAGTSGRLGVLDASECPPTFSTPPELVQGIIAGGQKALWTSIENAEDSTQNGVNAVDFRGVSEKDVLVGITASGLAPFVWGALHRAKELGAATIFVCFNPNLKYKECSKPDIVISPSLGPEVLTGSTRLKAGTATKLLLNIFTTLSMVRMGRVLSNLMVDLRPNNVKLRDRAARIVVTLTGVDVDLAKKWLSEVKWDVKAAVIAIKKYQQISIT